MNLSLDGRGPRVCHPQNIPLLDIDYFKLVISKEQKTQEKLLTLPLTV